MGLKLGSILKGAARLLLGSNPITAVLADALLPDRLEKATGLGIGSVKQLLQALRTDPATIAEINRHEEQMAGIAADLENTAMELSSKNLVEIGDIPIEPGEEFSWRRSLLGSPRRIGVTLAVVVLCVLSAIVGIRAIFVAKAVADPENLEIVFVNLRWAVVGLAGAYTMKYLKKV